AGGFGSMNGTRGNQINWQIDGIDNNDLWHNIPAVNQGGVSGIAGVILPLDAVEQFSAQSEASPESGRNPGGSVNLSLKSGTNHIHGTAYYYNRNEALGAISPITEAAGKPKQKVRNYNYGLSLGGPIIHDKLFYFITYEHQRFVIGVPAETTEPSVAYQAKVTSLLTANGVAVNPVSTNLLTGLWPANALTGAANPQNYTSNAPEFGYSYNGTAKVDYTINEKNSLSAHWFVGQGNQVAPAFGTSYLLPYFEYAPIHVQNYAVVYNRVVSSSVTNQLLAGVNYFNQIFNDNVHNQDPASLGLVTGSPLKGSPNIKISGFDAVGITPPEGRNDITGHLTEDLSWVVGKHQFKFGGEYRKAQLQEFYHRHALGVFKFNGTHGPVNPGNSNSWGYTGSDVTQVNSLADFLAGYVNSSSITIGDPTRLVYVNTFAVFGQDAWQFTPKFNVNYGLRWDFEGPLQDSKKDLSVFRPSQGGIVFQGAGIDNLYDPQYTDFSPRVGFSYQLHPKTVLRAGAGLYFDTPNLNPFLDNRPGNAAPNGVEGNPAGPNPVYTVNPAPYTIQAGVNPFTPSCSPAAPCGVFSVAKGFVPSYNLNFNAQLEQSLTDKVFFQIGYVGSEGRHLLSLLDINQAAFDPSGNTVQTSRPYSTAFPNYGNINEIQSIGNSNYNSLQTVLRVSSWHGVGAQATYTLSHNLDDSTSYRGSLPQDSTNFKADYGNSDFDNRNTFVGLVTYDLPGSHFMPLVTSGWQVNSLLTFHSGFPFTVLSSADTSGTNEGAQRANLVPGVSLFDGTDPTTGIRNHTQKVNSQWLNPAAFADPAPGALGTTKRNEFYSPGYNDVDLSVFKNTHITERVNTQLRVEMFNLFNRTNFAPPFSYSGGYNPNQASNGSFQLTDTIGDFNGAPGIGAGEPFNAQLALKIIF
ncbi:MAG TPA: TonB-dependent receptor, partial [Acidisarcina sp.]